MLLATSQLMDSAIVYPVATIGPGGSSPRNLRHRSFTLSNETTDGEMQIVFDYGRCEGGLPIFQIDAATGPDQEIPFRVTYSETRTGIDHETGGKFNQSFSLDAGES